MCEIPLRPIVAATRPEGRLSPSKPSSVHATPANRNALSRLDLSVLPHRHAEQPRGTTYAEAVPLAFALEHPGERGKGRHPSTLASVNDAERSLFSREVMGEVDHKL
jgi:hypothetical protein